MSLERDHRRSETALAAEDARDAYHQRTGRHTIADILAGMQYDVEQERAWRAQLESETATAPRRAA